MAQFFKGQHREMQVIIVTEVITEFLGAPLPEPHTLAAAAIGISGLTGRAHCGLVSGLTTASLAGLPELTLIETATLDAVIQQITDSGEATLARTLRDAILPR